jgi:hypothetical protein
MARAVLASQRAVSLAEKVKDADSVVAEAARRGMQVIVQAAVLKPPAEPWSTLREEAVEVRSALLALDQVQVSTDAPAVRLLRLAVFAALDQPQEVLAAAMRYLANAEPPKDAAPLSARDLDAVRLLAADAAVALGKRDEAERLLGERDPSLAEEPAALDVVEKLGLSLSDLNDDVAVRKAAPMLDRVLRATAATDPRYRARLVAWARVAARLGPEDRARAVALLDSKAEFFAAADCPANLRAEFDRLRAKPQ